MKKLSAVNKQGKYSVVGVKVSTSKSGDRMETLVINGAYFGGIPLALAQSIFRAYTENADVRKTLNGGNDAFISSMESGEAAMFEMGSK